MTEEALAPHALSLISALLPYALGIIGVLLTMLIGLVVYVFFQLKGEVRNVATEVGELSRNRVKLVHRADCRETTQRFQEQINALGEDTRELSERMTRVETALDLSEHC